ncbi:hypothetical protein HID58_004563 [Brassica napus]|uniref:Uncharacterized protein n=1 Tax=Brassica napus TaxID=3708 RepID=A0ABQ8E6S1_BRANA|nr:hypothetical protein HID58_004563 [Brassica napus]
MINKDSVSIRRWRMGSGCSSIWLVEDTIGGISRR